MDKIVFIGGSGTEIITQDELDYILSIDNQVLQLQRTRAILANSVFMRKLNGASVEPGAHCAEIETRCEGVRREQGLVIR